MSGALPSITIFMIGDSTMADKPMPNDQGEWGWGQALPRFLTPEARVANHAMNGRSTKSFIDEGRWKAVLDAIEADDWLVIQFGHNDEKPDPERHTDPFTSYEDNLRMFVAQARDKGAHPLLCTPIVRGGDLASHGDYPRAMRALAVKMDVPLVDLEKVTAAYI
jgi:DNA sulfur modification protein DndE